LAIYLVVEPCAGRARALLREVTGGCPWLAGIAGRLPPRPRSSLPEPGGIGMWCG